MHDEMMKKKWVGNSIHIQYIGRNDLEDICTMLEKESVCRYLLFGPNSHEVTGAYFKPLIESVSKELSEHERPTSPVFTIRSKDTGEFAGQCGLLPVEFCPGAYLIGYQIDDEWMGRGFGTEACEFLIYYAFTKTDAYRLNGDTASENVASMKIMEKCDFTIEGRRLKYWYARGRYYDQVLYGLLKENIDKTYLEYLKRKWES